MRIALKDSDPVPHHPSEFLERRAETESHLEPDVPIWQWRGANRLEVWGHNLSEHYLLTIDESHEPTVDVIWLS
jgi:hypothetical protein